MGQPGLARSRSRLRFRDEVRDLIEVDFHPLARQRVRTPPADDDVRAKYAPKTAHKGRDRIVGSARRVLGPHRFNDPVSRDETRVLNPQEFHQDARLAAADIAVSQFNLAPS